MEDDQGRAKGEPEGNAAQAYGIRSRRAILARTVKRADMGATERKLVFVIGAGASADFQFPVGRDNRWGKPPHLIVARGAQWTRDSLRDFKIVGGKIVELGPEDPDPEEEGIG
jgi:hypothetical protein